MADTDPKPAWWIRLLDADGDGAITIGDVQRWFLTLGMIRLLLTGGVADAVQAIKGSAVPLAPAPVAAPAEAASAPAVEPAPPADAPAPEAPAPAAG